MMRRTLTTLWLALAATTTFAAGWETPLMTNTWLYPRQERRIAMNCYTALYERAVAAGVPTAQLPMTPRWYRFNRTLMVNYKATVTNLMRYYCPTGAIAATVLAVREAGESGPADIRYGTAHWRLSAALHIPSNFWWYTPMRMRCGDGVFTNDTTVGRAYGYTNAQTAAGGSVNLPAGRTKWYTTDYDWGSLARAIDALRHVQAVDSLADVSYPTVYQAIFKPRLWTDGAGHMSADATWATARSESIAYFAGVSWANLDDSYSTWGPFIHIVATNNGAVGQYQIDETDGTYWTGNDKQVKAALTVTNIGGVMGQPLPTNMQHSADWFAYVQGNYDFLSVGVTNWDLWYYVGTSSTNAAAAHTSSTIYWASPSDSLPVTFTDTIVRWQWWYNLTGRVRFDVPSGLRYCGF